MPTLPLPHFIVQVMFPKKRMMSETYYPMNHVPWGGGSDSESPATYVDRETQCDGVFADRSTSAMDLGSADPSGDSGFGDHRVTPPPQPPSSSGDARRRESSNGMTDDASQGVARLTSSGAIYSEIASSTASPEREPFCLEDEIVHLSEEPLTMGEDKDEDGGRRIVGSERDLPRLDQVDGLVASAPAPDDNCGVDCLYYTLKCCDCRII